MDYLVTVPIQYITKKREIVMKRQEDFPGDIELISQYITENKKQWKKVEHTKEYIYVNLSMVRLQFGWIIPKLYFAKGLEEKTKANVIVMTWRENSLFTQLVESFGFEHIVLDSLNMRNIGVMVKALFQTMRFMLSDGTGEGLKKINAGDLKIGKNLYEDILRTSSLSTIISAKNKICIKKMIHLLGTVDSIQKLCLKKFPKFMICDDIAYHEGIFIKLFLQKNAKVFNVSSMGKEKITVKENGDIKTRSEQKNEMFKNMIKQLDESSVTWSEKYLCERYEGKNGRNIDRGAFSGKAVLSRGEAQMQLGLDPTKKNIVIMAHTFTDAVFNYGELFYRDYYDWTEQTLQLAAKNEKVNWILKPHPTRNSYHEENDSIEDMYERNRKTNIFLLPDDVSAESIRNFADVILTIGGNAGAEFACEGIPAIIIGKPYYQGFGYTIEPKSKMEYEKCLSSIEQIPRLNEEQVNTAKKLFYLNNYPTESIFADEFGTLINEEYKKMTDRIALQYFESNKGTESYNNDLIVKITEYVHTHDMTKCNYYQQGALHGSDN